VTNDTSACRSLGKWQTSQSSGDEIAATVAAVRGMMAGLVDFPVRWKESVRFIPVSADGVEAEWVVAEGASTERRLVHCHGGGWVAGGIDTSRGRGAALSRLSGTSVLLVNYRLAPEHRFPAGLQDCDTALSFAGRNGPKGIEDAAQLVLLGESAGGGLAASLCVHRIDAGHRMPDLLVLLCGQLSVAAFVDRVGRGDPLVSQKKLQHAYIAYTDHSVPPDDPRVSPLFTPLATLERFPPVLLQASGDEFLLHDARIFAGRLAEAGVRHVLSVWPGLPHSWHSQLDAIPQAEQALREVADFVYRETQKASMTRRVGE
jgi:monoterpene epsilon-lactone hydrolase